MKYHVKLQLAFDELRSGKMYLSKNKKATGLNDVRIHILMKICTGFPKFWGELKEGLVPVGQKWSRKIGDEVEKNRRPSYKVNLVGNKNSLIVYNKDNNFKILTISFKD